MSNVANAEVIDLHNDLNYQPDGIVSQVLLKQPAGSVAAFAFDAGQELSEHTCPYDALLLVGEGEANVRIGDAEHTLAAGRMIQLPANVPHAVQSRGRFKMLLTMLRAPEDN